MIKDTWTKIDARMTALSDLYARMDETEKLVYMEDFALTRFDGKTKLDRVINVTGNRAATYGHRVTENIASYKWQVVIDGVGKRDAHFIEEFLNANMAQTNKYLNDHFEDVPDLNTFWAKHVCNRGRIGAYWMSQVEDGEYKVYCVPLDMRWTPYLKGKWVAPIYFRKQDELEEELEGYEKKAKDGGGEFNKLTLPTSSFGYSQAGYQENEIRDYWDIEKHELWVNKQWVFKEKNIKGILPFVIVVAPSGFMFRGKGYVEHEGEDIYFLIRKLDKELNRSLSIEQTLGMDILYPGSEYETQDMTAAPARPLPRTGETAKVPVGELHHAVPRGDLNNASMIARQDMQRMIEEGAPMSPRAYTQPPSAVEVQTEVDLLSQLLHSRIIALQTGLSQLYRLMVEMAIAAGYEGEIAIGAGGKKKNFSVVKLKDPDSYSISVSGMTQSTKLEVINEARAMAMWGRAPLKYILEDILKVEDPDGWIRELDLEQARQADPALALFEMAVRYAEEAETIENDYDADVKKMQSKMLTERCVAMLKQRMLPAPMPEEVTAPRVENRPGNSQALIPLLGAGAGSRLVSSGAERLALPPGGSTGSPQAGGR